MGVHYQRPFDSDAWHKKYFSTMNDLLDLYAANPYLNISDVHTLVHLLDKVIGQLDERYQTHKKIEQLNEYLRTNPPKQD